jgi:hypothetical protein
VCVFYSSISDIKIAVPQDIPNSELIVAVPTLPAEEIPIYYSLGGWGKTFFILNVTRGELTMHTKVQLGNVKEGTSIIKIFGARPLTL